MTLKGVCLFVLTVASTASIILAIIAIVKKNDVLIPAALFLALITLFISIYYNKTYK